MGHILKLFNTTVEATYENIIRNHIAVLLFGAFFDVRLFRPNAPSYKSRNLSAVHKSMRMIQNVPTVSMCVTLKMLALPHLFFHAYSIIMGCLRCRLSFAVLRLSVMCKRESRSSFHHPVRNTTDIPLTALEGRVLINRHV